MQPNQRNTGDFLLVSNCFHYIFFVILSLALSSRYLKSVVVQELFFHLCKPFLIGTLSRDPIPFPVSGWEQKVFSFPVDVFFPCPFFILVDRELDQFCLSVCLPGCLSSVITHPKKLELVRHILPAKTGITYQVRGGGGGSDDAHAEGAAGMLHLPQHCRSHTSYTLTGYSHGSVPKDFFSSSPSFIHLKHSRGLLGFDLTPY